MSRKVAVLGAKGRMGSATCDAINAAPDLTLVASIGSGGSVADAVSAGADTVVDFTTPDAVMDHVADALAAGLHAVVGTSGFDDARIETIRAQVDQTSGVGVVIAPNFALGAVLLMRFAREAAPLFESVEIVELHHPDKLDAPSGTATHTAEVVAAARAMAQTGAMPDATTHSLAGARGASVAGVPVHSVRLRGLVAHEEVLLGNAGELLTIRHDSLDRQAFMPGVLLALRRVADRPGVTVGLEDLLDL